MRTLAQRTALALRTPPRAEREWTVHIDLDEGRPMDQPEVDGLVSASAPAGWVIAGCIACSRRDATCAPTWTGWYVRVTLVPECWRTRYVFGAPVAVYAAAQIAGVRTRLDHVLHADHYGVQYTTPEARPTVRVCGDWDGISALPPAVRRALDEVYAIDRRRTVGYMHARPNTDRALVVAMREADGDRARRAAACTAIASWVRETHPQVLSGGVEHAA